MKIGSVEIGIGAGLAPMAGVTDAAMRLLCFEQGAAWATGEMLSAKGWIYSRGLNKNAVELLERLPGEGIAALQLFGSEAKFVAEAAIQLEDRGYSMIDLNFGCPAPKITGNGEGSAMMRTPEKIGEVVQACVNAVKLPVTAKFRKGWDDDSVNAVEVARICEQAGAKALTVHGRTRTQQYSGFADRSIIRAVKHAVSVPVIGNGDVTSGADALSMMAETGCDAVAVGRGAQGNPWVFAEIRAAMTGERFTPPTMHDRVGTILRHLELEMVLHGEKRGLMEMRKHIAWYVSGKPGAARFRDTINAMQDKNTVRDALLRYADQVESSAGTDS